MSEEPTELKQYAILMPYLSYENTMYWQRGNFFLVANAALLGFVATDLPQLESLQWQSITKSIVMAAAGLILTYFWRLSLRAGEFWIFHWHELLKGLEEAAFGETLLLRTFKPTRDYPPRVRARPLAYGPVHLFVVLWAMVFAYSLVLAVWRVCG